MAATESVVVIHGVDERVKIVDDWPKPDWERDAYYSKIV